MNGLTIALPSKIANMLVTIERALWRATAEKLIQPKRERFQTPYDSSVSFKKDANLDMWMQSNL